MVRTALLCVVTLVGPAIAAATGLRPPALGDADLLAGLPLALDTTAVIVPTAADAVALDAEMRAFAEQVAAVPAPEARLSALAEGMEARGLFSLEYVDVTRTAAATFHDRQGNCLSFTMLFVALARAANLATAYQTVTVPPTWSNDGQVVVANHVNAVVRTGARQITVVDFNLREYEGDRPSRRVGDDYVLALFYANLGAEALVRGDRAAALASLREAARLHPEVPGVWVNLGVLYARERLYDYAEAAYLRAVEVNPDELSALSNLAHVYAAIDEPELAAHYSKRVQSYRERNPYYHFALATEAYEERRPLAALAAVRKALKLKKDDPDFHALQGQAFEALGRMREATRSLQRAHALTAEDDRRHRARLPADTLALR
jgi:Flp pilus assembly protein TadD